MKEKLVNIALCLFFILIIFLCGLSVNYKMSLVDKMEKGIKLTTFEKLWFVTGR